MILVYNPHVKPTDIKYILLNTVIEVLFVDVLVSLSLIFYNICLHYFKPSIADKIEVYYYFCKGLFFKKLWYRVLSLT